MAPPTLLLIHGCFSGPASFDRLVPYLEGAGYPTLRATYPSSNAERPFEVTAQKDIDHVRNEYLLPLVEQEHKDLILVVHSFGGVVAAGARGLSKTDRVAEGLSGGIVGLIYVAGNIVQENQSIIESAGGQWPPWLIKDKPRLGVAIIDPLIETLAADCDESLHASIHAGMLPQGYLCLDTKSSTPCWSEDGYTGRLAYVRTAADQVNPAFAQDLWIKGSGVKWDVVTMETSHAPYLSQPKQLAEHIVKFATKFEAL